MGQVKKHRYVARAIPGAGWRIWDGKQQRFRGEIYRPAPDALLAELNGPKRPEHLTRIARALRAGQSG